MVGLNMILLQFWGTFWGQMLIELIGGTIGSLIFLFIVLFFLKPTVRISPFICKHTYGIGDTNEYYFIKIVNRSLFSAFEVKAELHMLQHYPTPPKGMMNTRYTPLNLIMSNISHVPAYRPSWFRKGALYAFRIRTDIDLNEILTDQTKSIEVKISLKHGLTGLSKVYTQEYSDLSEIKNGKFAYGKRFGVMS